jgi:hypothetical protein
MIDNYFSLLVIIFIGYFNENYYFLLIILLGHLVTKAKVCALPFIFKFKADICIFPSHLFHKSNFSSLGQVFPIYY